VTVTYVPGGSLAAAGGMDAPHAIRLVAERLAAPDRIAHIAGRQDNVDPTFRSAMWDPVSLAVGHPGVALLYGELAAHDARWLPHAQGHLRAAMQALPARPSNGLHYGPAAVLAAAQTVAAGSRHNGDLRRRLAEWLANDQLSRVQLWAQRRRHGPAGVGWSAYDVVNGLTGTGRLLLDSVDDPAETSPLVERAVRETLSHLVTLSEPVLDRDRRRPGWWVPRDLQPVPQDQEEYPRGDVNLGLAHGIPGPLMLLCLAAERERSVPGQPEAIARIAGWLVEHVAHDDHGPYWPARISVDQLDRGERGGFTRSAWCYGAPGVAGALHRAGTLLHRPDWAALAVDALLAVTRRPPASRRLAGPTVCHGSAGLQQVLLRAGQASGDRRLLTAAEDLGRDVLAFADPELPFVFGHWVPASPQGWQESSAHHVLDGAGVLEGASGVACALLSLLDPEGRRHRPCQWDRVLLLS
jgi:lantibiotic biosynthesis protein